MTSTGHPHETGGRLLADARFRLRLTKIVLLTILLILCGIGRRTRAWPLHTWPMYSRNDTAFPPPVTFDVEVRVTSQSGLIRRFSAYDFMPVGRIIPVRDTFEGAINDPDPVRKEALRRYVVRLITGVMPADSIRTIEVWRMEWAVDPFASRPLDPSRLSQEVRLGSFSASDHEGRRRGGL